MKNFCRPKKSNMGAPPDRHEREESTRKKAAGKQLLFTRNRHANIVGQGDGMGEVMNEGNGGVREPNQ